LCEGCGSISVKNNGYVYISILKSRVKNLYGTNGKSISIYVTFLPWILVRMRAVCATVPDGMWIGYGWSLCVMIASSKRVLVSLTCCSVINTFLFLLYTILYICVGKWTVFKASVTHWVCIGPEIFKDTLFRQSDRMWSPSYANTCIWIQWLVQLLTWYYSCKCYVSLVQLTVRRMIWMEKIKCAGNEAVWKIRKSFSYRCSVKTH
jgi:hypothetical protein